MENNENNQKLYTTSFVLGLIAFLIGGLVLSILGLVFSVKGKKVLKNNNETNGMVTAGLVLSILGLVKTVLIIVPLMLGIIVSLVWGNEGILNKSVNNKNTYYNNYNKNYSSSYYNY